MRNAPKTIVNACKSPRRVRRWTTASGLRTVLAPTTGYVWSTSPAFAGVVDPARGGPELDRGECDQQDEEEPGQGAGVAHLRVGEGAVVNVHGVEVGRVRGPALGRRVGGREGL